MSNKNFGNSKRAGMAQVKYPTPLIFFNDNGNQSGLFKLGTEDWLCHYESLTASSKKPNTSEVKFYFLSDIFSLLWPG